MKYVLKPSFFFLKQLDDISGETAKLIEEKLKLVKINPYRYKRIQGYSLFLFRIRIKDKGKEIRIIYLVDKHFIKILCILDRSKNYNDLKRYLKKLNYV
ncbi:type II toxin-antitoxin system RelE/ParE family toxin [Nanoarchaeota archaeon]